MIIRKNGWKSIFDIHKVIRWWWRMSDCYSTPQVDKAIPPCGHVFCYQCLTKWNNMSKWRTTCPVWCSTAFYEISHKNRKEQIRPIIKHYFAQLQHDFLQLISYMEWTVLSLFIWIVSLVKALDLSTSGIIKTLMIMFTLSGTVCSILQYCYVLLYGFLPRNFVSNVSFVNCTGFFVTTLYFRILSYI